VPGAPFISFLSDYGLGDEFVGVCHGVIARGCPQAHVVDITHAIPRHDVLTGALVLRDAVPYTPQGVHLAVVDPHVGATGSNARRGVALATADGTSFLVGPDNGLLMLAAERLGGVVSAVDLAASPQRLARVSSTFHGRDVFAPVAAALAAGQPLGAVGQPLAVEDLQPLELPHASVAGGELTAHVLRIDHFGNVILDATRDELAAAGLSLGSPVSLQIAATTHRARYGSTFADVATGELLLYEDAQQSVAVAVNRGSAAEQLAARSGQLLMVRAA